MTCTKWIVGFLFCGLAGQAWAGGYEVEAQDTTLLGTANAGKTTVADSATVLFWNPAGLAFVDDTNFRFSITNLYLDQEFTDQGTTNFLGIPATGSSVQDGIEPAWVPSFAFSWPLNDRVAFGIGLQSQFGLKTDWGEEWVGRYHATRSELLTLNLSPAVSWRVNDQFSLGAGLGIQYAKTKLANQIDFGSIGFVSLPPDLSETLGLAPQQNDGSIDVHGDDVDVGFTLGLLWEPMPAARVGLGYRSEIKHDLGGDAYFEVPPPAQILTLSGQFLDTGATTKLLTPALASLGFQYSFNSRWNFLADVTWVDWSAVESLDVIFDNPEQPPVSAPANWKDTYRFSVGLTYEFDDNWTLRGGFADAPSPVPDSTRNARLADSDRKWFSLGASRKIGDRATIDMAYIYIDQDDAPIDFTDPLSGRIVGNVEWSAQVFSLGTTVYF